MLFVHYIGVVSSYVVYPLTLWISIQVGYTLLAVCTPLYFKHLNKKRKKRWCIHIASLLAGFVAILVPTMLSLFLGGYSSVDTRFPPIVCWTKDRDLTVYTFLIPMGVMLSVIDTELILILHYLIR